MAESLDDISSDSDDSIQEVPVPPKPAPLLIDINDSEESSSSDEEEATQTSRPKKTRKSSPRVNNDDSNEPAIIVDDHSNSNPVESNNIVLNCTAIQPEQAFSGIRELRAYVNGTRGSRGDIDAESADKVSDSSGNTARRHVSNEGTPIEALAVPRNDPVTANNPGKSPSTQKRPRKSLEPDPLNANEEQSRKRLKSSASASAEVPFNEYLFRPVDKSIEAFYNEPCHEDSTKDVREIQKEMSNDPRNWSILGIDRQCSRPRSRGKICASCQREGHTRDRCPEKRKSPSCHMCGKPGHLESRCPDSMCLTCGTKYTTYRKTCEYCRTLKCGTCKGIGHKSNDCPDLWRRYHQTVSGTQVNVPENPNKVLKPTNQLWCCNCTKSGHDSTNCNKYRWTQHFTTPRYVTNYNKAPFYKSTTPETLVQSVAESSIPVEIQPAPQPEPPVAQSSSPQTPKRKNIFSFHNFDKNVDTSKWQSKTIQTSTLECYQPVSNEYPCFLKKHFPLNSPCKMIVHMHRDFPSQDMEIDLKGPSESIELIDKLLLQWLARSSDDRRLIEEADPLPWNSQRFLIYFARKCNQFNNMTNAHGWKRYKKVVQMQNEVKNQMTKDLLPGQKKKLDNRITTLVNSKRRLVAGVYNYGMIPTAKQTLDEFQNLLDQVKNLPDAGKVTSTMYMAGLWFDLELFTPHYSSYISAAAKLWESRVLSLPNIGKRHRATEESQNIQRLLPKCLSTFQGLAYTYEEQVVDSCDEQTEERMPPAPPPPSIPPLVAPTNSSCPGTNYSAINNCSSSAKNTLEDMIIKYNRMKAQRRLSKQKTPRRKSNGKQSSNKPYPRGQSRLNPPSLLNINVGYIAPSANREFVGNGKKDHYFN